MCPSPAEWRGCRLTCRSATSFPTLTHGLEQLHGGDSGALLGKALEGKPGSKLADFDSPVEHGLKACFHHTVFPGCNQDVFSSSANTGKA